MPALTSAQYAAEFNEVKALGAQSGSSRTDGPDADGRVLHGQSALLLQHRASAASPRTRGCRRANRPASSPRRAWRERTRSSAAGTTRSSGTPGDRRRRSTKRRTTAIRSPRRTRTGRRSSATPGYPDEPSGYNCYTGGFWQSARFFFGTDKYAFSLTSPGVPANAGRGKSRRSRRVDQDLQPVHRCHRRHDRRPDPQRLPLPDGRRQRRLDRQEGRPVDRQALLRGRRLTPRRTTNGRPGSPQAGRFRCSVTRPPVLPGWTMGKNTAGSPPRGP